ncbi:MAG: hypothetical protein K2H93_04340 [Oscillospiraceae bacterium]|nr:hypothetical protein [Oscillospiraceae bacterium]
MKNNDIELTEDEKLFLYYACKLSENGKKELLNKMDGFLMAIEAITKSKDVKSVVTLTNE